MIWTGKDSQIVRANERMAELVGYTVDELQAMRYEDLIFPRIATNTAASGTRKSQPACHPRTLNGATCERTAVFSGACGQSPECNPGLTSRSTSS